MGKAKSSTLSGATERRFTNVGSCKHYTILERLTRFKRSSLLQTFVNYSRKKVLKHLDQDVVRNQESHVGVSGAGQLVIQLSPDLKRIMDLSRAPLGFPYSIPIESLLYSKQAWARLKKGAISNLKISILKKNSPVSRNLISFWSKFLRSG